MGTLADACAALAGDAGPPVPWLAPYQPIGRGVALDVRAGRTVAQALNAVPAGGAPGARPVRFVAPAECPAGEAYEAFIARTACVPTRDNAHDLFNGLVWLRFGALKARLNGLHAQQLACHGVGRTRGAVRDALTLFDENAALLQAPPALVDALQRRDWTALFIDHRLAWQGATLTLVGHALLEKLLQPRKAITTHVWLLPPGIALDAPGALPAGLPGPGWPVDCPRLPLPVLGVPGWWAANEEGNFYLDASVFRPARPRPAGAPPAAGDAGPLKPAELP